MTRPPRIEMPEDFSPVAPRPAAAVLLLRPATATPFEIFLTVRHAAMDFLPGAIVFPGGSLDAGDTAPPLLERTRGVSGLSLAQAGFRVAAIREAYEECGVLLARPRGRDDFVSGARLTRLAAKRDALNQGTLSFAAFVEAEDLELAADCLVPLSRWVTPWWHRKRFDTQFFVAPAPSGQEAAHDGRESVESLWVDPIQILARGDKWSLLLPTRANIDALKDWPSVHEALSAVYPDGERTVMAWVEIRGEQFVMCAQLHPGGPVFENAVPDPATMGINARMAAEMKARLAGRDRQG